VQAVQQAVDIVRMGGTISVVGLHETPVPQLDMGNIVVRDLNLITSVASPNAFKQTIRLMEKGKIDVRPLITHEFPLSEAAQALTVQETKPRERTKIQLYPD
jgi:threonine dehydrogenase-like Zn-dependent dehydrogenase